MSSQNPPADAQGGILYNITQPNPNFSDYDRWYNTEHGPLRMRLDFVRGGYRYKAVLSDKASGPVHQNPTPISVPTFLAMYDLSRLSGLDEEPYKRLTKERSAYEHDVYANKMSSLSRNVYRDLSCRARGGLSGPAPVILAAAFVVRDDRADELHRWYEEEHVQDISRIPGWRRSRRFRSVNHGELREGGKVVDVDFPDGKSELLALHDFDEANGLDGPEYDYAQTRPWRLKVVGSVVESRDVKRWELIHEFEASDYRSPS